MTANSDIFIAQGSARNPWSHLFIHMLQFGFILSVVVFAVLEFPGTCDECLVCSDFVNLIHVTGEPSDKLSITRNCTCETPGFEESLGKQFSSVYQTGGTKAIDKSHCCRRWLWCCLTPPPRLRVPSICVAR